MLYLNQAGDIMFFGRENEKKKILSILVENSMQVCLVYGRRRVGKSELINHCLQETNKKKYIFRMQANNFY